MMSTHHTIDSEKKTLELNFGADLLSTNHESIGKDLQTIFALPEVARSSWGLLILDLRKASLIDSMGLNLIVGLIKQARIRPAKVKALITSRTIHRTFLFTQLEKHMEISLEIPEAKAS